MKILLRVALGLVAAYVLAVGAMFGAMHLAPGRFANLVAGVPSGVVMGALPFRPLWAVARAGSLSVGDPAPDFELPRQDKSGRVRLSGERGRPVVLVFGSYS